MNVKMESDTDSLLLSLSQEEDLLNQFKTESSGIMDTFLNADLMDLNEFVTNENESCIGLETYVMPPDATQLQQFNVRPQQVPASATSKLPSTEDYPGELGFSLELHGLNCMEKKWIYSSSLNKVFINMNKILPIRFQWRQEMTEMQLHVRALLVFTSSQYFQEPVERCHHHGTPIDKSNRNFMFVDHIIRSEHPAAVYELDEESERRSVVIPLDRPQPGDDTVTGMYSFHCKNSCPSGMNRRATQIIFTLEDDAGTVKGRQTLKVRICSCPKRDMNKEEEDECKETKQTLKRPMKTSATSTANKKTKLDNSLHTVRIQVKGVEAVRGVLRHCLGVICTKAKEEKRDMDDEEKMLEQQYLSLLDETSP